MSHLSEKNEEFKVKFKWGITKGVGRINKDIHFYDSFTFEDVEYCLYDCAYLYRTGDRETSIGKIVKIYETPTLEKKVKVVWLFRPIEIREHLGDYVPRWNELLLASGEGIGLSNINPLEAVVQKCNVVCTSNDQRNPQPSEAELRKAEYIFCRTFDVGNNTISENFADKIDGVKVEHYFNRKKAQKLINPPNLEANIKEGPGKSNLSSKLGLDKAVGSAAKNGMSGSKVSPVVKGSKNAAITVGEQRHFPNENTTLRPKVPIDKDESRANIISCNQIEENAEKVRLSEDLLPMSDTNIRLLKKRKLLLDEKGIKIPDKRALQSAQDRGFKTESQFEEVTRRPGAERRNWFKQLPWEERLMRARKEGTVVSVQNLDPSFTSSEVEDLVWHAFNEMVEAKMIQCSTFSLPHNGEALVLFKSKDAAESAISKLKSRCLELADGRIVVGGRATLREPGKPASFVGHMVLDKITSRRQREEMRSAVSTAHCSQPNTIEYEMAMEWHVLQKKSEIWWNAIQELHAKEKQDVMRLLRVNRNR